jgi:hypothetical protein
MGTPTVSEFYSFGVDCKAGVNSSCAVPPTITLDQLLPAAAANANASPVF